MTVIHISKLLIMPRVSGSWYKRPNSLASYISRRNVQEFPEVKMKNELHRDYVLVLPEPCNEKPETNELLRLPKAGESEIDFTKLDAESVFKGFSQTVCSFEDFITDFTNNPPQSERPLREFLKDIERRLYPMDSSYNICMCLWMLNNPKYNFKEFHDLIERYLASRDKRHEEYFKVVLEDYASRDFGNLNDSEKRLLKIYHPAKPSTGISSLTNINEGHVFHFKKNLRAEAEMYHQHTIQADKLFSHTVDDPDILAAISSEFELCNELHHKERTPLKITHSTYEKFMQVCPDRFVRQMLWQTRNKRCSPKGPPKLNNFKSVDYMRVLRRKIANILGYRTHVEYRMSEAMAQSKKQVSSGLESLQQENIVKLRDRLEELNEFADNNQEDHIEGDNSQGIQAYDIDYWSHKFRYDVLIGKRDADLRAYFPLQVVMRGLLGYFKDYFGIEMKIKSEPNKYWDESVQFIEVQRNNQALGSIIFDPYQRPEKRISHSFYGRIRSRNTELGCLPCRFISTSYRRDQTSNQARLSLADTIELFKYFATVLQRLMYNYGYYELNTYGALELEVKNLIPNLCVAHLLTDYRILQSCSDRGGSKPIDAELASRLLKSLTYFNSLKNWYELYKAHLDLEAHSSLASIESLVQEAYSLYSPFPRDPGDYDYCAMPDIFVGPNDGVQYSSLWSKQLANFCLQHSLTGSGVSDITASDVSKLREFNAKLLDSLFNSENLNTSDKLIALTGEAFEPSKTGLGVL